MATTELATTVREVEGVAVIELHGDIDGRADEALDAAYTQAERSGDVRLDFSGVTYMNSTGIALIVGLLARARKNGNTLSAAGLSHHYREIFEITRLADFMTIVDEEGQA